MSEFFGIGGYLRQPEGYLSWQHLVFVSTLLLFTFTLAVIIGLKNRKATEEKKNRPLKITAILINFIEISYIVFLCVKEQDPLRWLYHLPLFLCTVQLITLPLAAFSRGRIREAALDFVFIFGILGAVLGTYGAGQNYACYPVLSVDNVESGVVHCIAGFSALYIAVSGMASMKKKNVPIAFAIITGICAVAYAADMLIDYNYMFLLRGDGTPYDLLYNLVNGNPVLYPLGVLLLFLLYVLLFYLVFILVKRSIRKTDRRK